MQSNPKVGDQPEDIRTVLDTLKQIQSDSGNKLSPKENIVSTRSLTSNLGPCMMIEGQIPDDICPPPAVSDSNMPECDKKSLTLVEWTKNHPIVHWTKRNKKIICTNAMIVSIIFLIFFLNMHSVSIFFS